MSISIIIPTYDNLEFIDELINSINENKTSFDYEVLFGIDNCEKTKQYIEENKFPDHFKFFYFLENVGPYKIKNTLSEISTNDNLLFFDSDDVMTPSCIEEINNKLDKYECVKPKFINFKDKGGNRNFEDGNGLYGEGVFGIHKKLFLSMNGFEGWRCAADSDFMGRLYKSKRKIHLTSSILFHRRIHNKSLTRDPKTGYASRVRGEYFRISKNKTDHGPLPFLSTANYVYFNKDNSEWEYDFQPIKKEVVDNELEMKQKKQQLISSVFDGTKREILPKQPKTIDYDTVNQNTNYQTSSKINSALSKAKLENIQKRFGRR